MYGLLNQTVNERNIAQRNVTVYQIRESRHGIKELYTLKYLVISIGIGRVELQNLLLTEQLKFNREKLE